MWSTDTRPVLASYILNVDGNATLIIGWTTISNIFKRLYIEKNEKKNMNNTLAS